MGINPYPNYKPSNLDWIDSMPAHWGNTKLRWVSEIYAGGTPSRNKQEYWENGTIPWISSGEVNQEFITEPSTYISIDGFINSSAKWIPENALVMALAGQGKTKGMVAQVGIRTTCNQSMAAIVPQKLLPRYLYYWLKNNYKNLRGLVGDDQREGLNLNIVGSISVPVLPEDEQQAIADFLDRETSIIDTLIAKKQALIQRLHEKRTALISHIVIKGLDPTAPMKDSGIEWLNQIPAHWEIIRLKFKCEVKARLGWRGLKASEYVNEGYIFLSTPNIKGDEIDFVNVNYISEERYYESPEIILQEGYVLLAKDGSTLGITNVVRNLPRPATVNSSIAVLKPARDIDSVFFYHYLSGNHIQNLISQLKDGMGVPHLFQADIREFLLLLPPLSEQQEIAKHLDEQTKILNDLINKVESAIEKSQEYRNALISAAVTGKIDVRTHGLGEA